MFNITNCQRNANQDDNEIPPHTPQNGYYQKNKKQQVLVKMWKKGNSHTLLVGMSTGAAIMENSISEVPHRTKIEPLIGSSNSTPGYLSEKKKKILI